MASTMAAIAVPVPPGYAQRPGTEDDIPRLGDLYFTSYDDGLAGATAGEATGDIAAAFDGAYGELWPEASLVTTTKAGQLVGAIQVVRLAPWPDAPRCPFIIELFTHRLHRRRGIAGGAPAQRDGHGRRGRSRSHCPACSQRQSRGTVVVSENGLPGVASRARAAIEGQGSNGE